MSEELSDEWMYELAELYHRAGMREACLDLCDRITILFGTGEWVQKALRLKAEGEGEPLNEYQQSILQGEIYYQPTAPRQNAVREPAPLTTPYAQQPMMATEYGTQMPYQTAAAPYGMEPAPALAEQYAAPMTQPQPTAFAQPAEFTQSATFAQPEESYDQARFSRLRRAKSAIAMSRRSKHRRRLRRESPPGPKRPSRRKHPHRMISMRRSMRTFVVWKRRSGMV